MTNGPIPYDRRTRIVSTPGWSDAGEEMCGLLLLDVDNHELITDAYGPATADLAVQHVMEAVHAEVRPTDVLVGFGGHEFAVVLPGADAAYAQDVAERVRAAVTRSPMDWNGRTIRLTVSIGATGKFPASEDMVDALLAQADECLDEAKRTGGNRSFPAAG